MASERHHIVVVLLFLLKDASEQVYNCLIEIESDGTCRGIRVFLDLPIEVDYRQKLLSKN
jgi:hypothetical protein